MQNCHNANYHNCEEKSCENNITASSRQSDSKNFGGYCGGGFGSNDIFFMQETSKILVALVASMIDAVMVIADIPPVDLVTRYTVLNMVDATMVMAFITINFQIWT